MSKYIYSQYITSSIVTTFKYDPFTIQASDMKMNKNAIKQEKELNSNKIFNSQQMFRLRTAMNAEMDLDFHASRLCSMNVWPLAIITLS